MSKYDVNIKGFGLMLLPTFLRKPVMAGLLYALLSPLTYIYARFRALRKTCDYRLYHNGQVCYLRALLNDQFDPFYRRITISEDPEFGDNVVIYEREVNTNDPVPQRQEKPEEGEEPGGRTITRRGFSGTNAYDFWVNVPYQLYQEIDIDRLKAVVNSYKLASKRFGINYK